MKNLLLALTIVLGFSNAHAGNDGPNAIKAPTKTIARVQVGSGFAPPDYPRSHTVDVKDDGEVIVVKKWSDGKSTFESLAILGSEKIALLKKQIAGMSNGEVVDPNPSELGCMDAPTTTFLAEQSGSLTKIAQNMQCKEYRKKNMNDDDQAVIRTLEILLDLSY